MYSNCYEVQTGVKLRCTFKIFLYVMVPRKYLGNRQLGGTA